jgi:hypothetical protein
VGQTYNLGQDSMEQQSAATLSADASNGHQRRVFTEVFSALAMTSATSDSYWQDTANGKVHVKAYGGYRGPQNPANPAWFTTGPSGVWLETDPRWDGGYGDNKFYSHPFYLGICARV